MLRIGRPRSARRLAALAAVALVGLYGGNATAGTRGRSPIRSFQAADYRAHPQCWAMVQDPSGLIHVANSDGLLSFDGSRWEKRRLANDAGATALCVGPDGNVYVGATAQLARLRADAAGQLHYERLGGDLPLDQHPQGDVWFAIATSREVFLATLTQIYRVGMDGSVECINDAPGLDFEGEFFALEVWKDQLWVASSGKGLYRWTGSQFDLVVPDSKTRDKKNPSAFDIDYLADLTATDDHLVVVDSNRLFRFDGRRFDRFPTEADSLFARSWAYVGFGLAGGRLAIGTVDGGAVLLDSQGELIEQWDDRDGLLHNAVSEFGTDTQGGLWVCQEVGLVRVDLDAPIEIFPEVSGLVTDVEKYEGDTYLTTSHGFYRLVTRPGDRARFELIEGANDFTGLEVTSEGLFVAESSGVSRWDGKNWKNWTLLDYPSSLTASRFVPQRLMVVSRGGLELLSTEADSIAHLATIELPLEGSTLVETGPGELWVGSREGRALRIELNESYSGTSSIELLDATHGIPASLVLMAHFEGMTLLGSFDGLHVFRNESFERASLIDFESGQYEVLEAYGDELWALVDGEVGQIEVPESSGEPWAWESRLARNRFNGRAYSFAVQGDDVWASQADRVVRWPRQARPVAVEAFAPMLRRVIAPSDSTLWSGTRAPSALEFEYDHNSLRFDFSSTTQRGENDPLFRSYLEGHDRAWSDWSAVPYREYTNLREGRYVLRIRAQDGYGAVSSELRIPLTIRPPWIRTTQAQLLLGVLGILTIVAISVGFNSLRSHQLRLRNRALEERVQARTTDLERANLLLKETNIDLEDLNEELRQVDAQRNELLGIAAHDLKTPLGNIRSLAELIEADIDPSSDPAEFVNLIRESADRMLYRVQGMLTSVAAEAGHIQLELTQVDVTRLAEKVVESQKATANSKGQILRLDLSPLGPEGLSVLGDTERLLEAFENLVSNAIKYSPPNAPIDVAVSRTPEGLARLQVADRGPGLSEEESALLFSPFQQLSPKPTGDEDSCGLGLHIVKHIVELHGGSVWVDTELGRGSTFGFDLPPEGAASEAEKVDESQGEPVRS